MSQREKPTLYIREKAFKKMQFWTEHCDTEISGIGVLSETRCPETKKTKYVVEDTFIVKQECTGAYTDLDQQELGKLTLEIMDKFPNARIGFHWHSHCDMGVFASGTDESNYDRFSNSYAFAMVINKKGDTYTRLDIHKPFRAIVEKIPFEIIPETPKHIQKFEQKIISLQERIKEMQEKLEELKDEHFEELSDLCEKEVEEKVTEKKYTSTAWENGKYTSQYGGYGDDENYYQTDWLKNKNYEKPTKKLFSMTDKEFENEQFTADELDPNADGFTSDLEVKPEPKNLDGVADDDDSLYEVDSEEFCTTCGAYLDPDDKDIPHVCDPEFIMKDPIQHY